MWTILVTRQPNTADYQVIVFLLINAPRHNENHVRDMFIWPPLTVKCKWTLLLDNYPQC